MEETGGMDQGSVFLNANRYQLTGEHFEKQIGQAYAVTNGSFTTCVCKGGESPSWSIRGQRVNLDLAGYGRVKGGTFAVKNVPILYVPYGIFPIQRDRQTGFLFPRFGYSNRRGFQIEQPFFLDINKSHDATISLDLETDARIGALAEYRYALSPDTIGEISGSYFNEQIRGASYARHRQLADRRPQHPDQPLERGDDPRPVAPVRRQGLRRRAAGERRPLPARDQRLHLQSRASTSRSARVASSARVSASSASSATACCSRRARGTRTSSTPIASTFRSRRASRPKRSRASSTTVCCCTSTARA